MNSIYKDYCSFHLFIALTIFMSACGKDDDATPQEEVTAECTMIGFATDQTGLLASINRDANGRVIEVEYSSASFSTTSSMEYDSEGTLVKIVSADDVYSTLAYHNDNLVGSETRYRKWENSEEFYIERTVHFFYGTDKRVIKDSTSTPSSFVQLRRYEYAADGNLSKIFITTPFAEEYLATEYIEFDDKIAPFWGYDFYYIYSPTDKWVITEYNPPKTKYNVISLKRHSGQTSTVTTYSYEMNEEGYVTTSTSNRDNITSTTTFNYDCQ